MTIFILICSFTIILAAAAYFLFFRKKTVVADPLETTYTKHKLVRYVKGMTADDPIPTTSLSSCEKRCNAVEGCNGFFARFEGDKPVECFLYNTFNGPWPQHIEDRNTGHTYTKPGFDLPLYFNSESGLNWKGTILGELQVDPARLHQECDPRCLNDPACVGYYAERLENKSWKCTFKGSLESAEKNQRGIFFFKSTTDVPAY